MLIDKAIKEDMEKYNFDKDLKKVFKLPYKSLRVASNLNDLDIGNKSSDDSNVDQAQTQSSSKALKGKYSGPGSIITYNWSTKTKKI